MTKANHSIDQLERLWQSTSQGQWEYTGVAPLPRVRLDAQGTCTGILLARGDSSGFA
jgi:hypothetical protein